MSRMLSVLAGASLLAMAGAANAGEPVTLTSAELDGVTAGSGCRICSPTYYQFDFAKVKTELDLQGNLAKAKATADAYGRDSFSRTVTSAKAIKNVGSFSSSQSVAAVD